MRLRSSAKWKHELIEATRFAIPWPVRSILGELPLEISDPLSSIPAEPYWWMDPRLHSAVADIDVEVSAIVACAIGLVRAGYRPTTWVCNAHEQKIDEPQLLANNCLNRRPTGTCIDASTQFTIAQEVLDALWPAIEQLATDACNQTRRSPFENWNLIWPDTENWLATDAYHLAARAVASRELDIEPTDLAILNEEGTVSRYLYAADQQPQLALEEMAVLTFTGLLASARATRNIIMVPRDPDLEVVRRFLIGDGGELEYAKLDLFANAEERSNRIVARCWNKIECVANVLHRERRISCDEVWYLLDGGTIEL